MLNKGKGKPPKDLGPAVSFICFQRIALVLAELSPKSPRKRLYLSDKKPRGTAPGPAGRGG